MIHELEERPQLSIVGLPDKHYDFVLRATELLTSSIDYRSALAAVAKLAVPDLADWCAVHLLDGKELKHVAVAHEDPERAEWARQLGDRYPPDSSAPSGIYNVIRTGEPELYREITDEMLVRGARDEEHLRILRSLGVREVMIVPLASRTRTLGVISFISSDSRHTFDNGALQRATEIGRLAGTAVDNALLFKSSQESQRRMAVLAEASAALLGELNTEAVLPKLLDLAAEVLQADGHAIWAKDTGTGVWRVAASQGLSADYIRDATVLISRASDDVIGFDEPIVAEDIEGAPWLAAHREAHLKEGTRSLLVAPFKGERGLAGTIAFYFKKPRVFDENETKAAQALANLAGAAIRAFDIYQAEQRARERAERDLADRIVAEEKLQEKERDLRDFVENATIGLHWVGPDGTILWANRAELEMLGYSPEEYIGHNISEFHADRPVIDEILHRLSCRETLNEYPARLRTKDGSIRSVVINSNVYFEGDRFIHTRCFTRDVTDEMMARQALEASEERFRGIVEAAQEGIWVVDADYKTTFVNGTTSRMLGYSPDEMLGRPVSDFMDEEERENFRSRQANRKEGSTESYDSRYKRKDGSDLWVIVSASPIRDGRDRFAGAVALLTDITDRKQWEMERARLAAIVDTSEDAIVSKDLNGIVTSWNAAAERLYGWPAAEIIGRSKGLVIPSDLPNELSGILEKVRRGERMEHYETRRIRKDGTIFDVAISVSPVKNAAGEITGAATIVRDISQQVKARQEIEALNARLKRAMQETHHRVKNNLQIMAAMVELKVMDSAKNEHVPVTEFARLGTHVRTLAAVHDVLTKYLREDEREQMVSVQAIFSQLIPLLQQAGEGRSVEAAIEDVKLTGKQATALAIVANELIYNSLKHGSGTIEVFFTSSSDEAVLTVRDGGPGFPPGFDTAVSANTGLQLVDALVVTDLGGEVKYENHSEGGAQVRVTIPMPSAAE